jgi:hypothetical protein
MMQMINIKSSRDGRQVRYSILPLEGRTTSFKSAYRVYSTDSVNEIYTTPWKHLWISVSVHLHVIIANGLE